MRICFVIHLKQTQDLEHHYENFKEQLKQIVREELKNLSEKEVSLSGKEVAHRIKNSKDKNHKMFFGKKALEAIAKKSKLTAKELDHMLPDYIPGNLIHGLFTEAEVNEMRPHASKDLPGETIWQHISDHYDWEDYLGKGGMRELEKSLKKMKRVKPQQLDQMLLDIFLLMRCMIFSGTPLRLHQPNENFKRQT